MTKFQIRRSLQKLLVSLLCIGTTITVVNVADAFKTDPGSIYLQKAKASKDKRAKYDQLRQEWSEKSISYYSKITREERRWSAGQIDQDVFASEEYRQEFEQLAKKHYFALKKIKEGRYHHAEIIYERIIKEIMKEDKADHSCDHANLAVTTLLLALNCQRMGNPEKARLVFLNFVHVVTTDTPKIRGENKNNNNFAIDKAVVEHDECACSAKVLGAFALFEMKQGNPGKSLEIAHMAVDFDPSLEPMLEWKEFRDVRMGTKSSKL
mmetsp:Transcript_18811/g.52542  ORF Transcript_18811/g.52542 Transcript_18811/m.52542 type:complete len:266 (-) Transcript_18811:186-983(-)|eukprot:CAMPEP_0172362996 /NCGR_PEP_ID=MMETSP1060-20121228/6478_1 /TAXON_ID=37318 /ORGANISM="Pseudo-nitzschia pungens, Strain cf. cingulata" /LENGTH=265 /DNA_ID=CAMNT_0013085635 /DNA_START=196 /DNA_END=993 /DNA_ORIENTATION=-